MQSASPLPAASPFRRIFLTGACFLAFIALGIASSIVGPTLSDLTASVNLQLADAGILRALRQAGSFAAILIGGRLLDRFDWRFVLIPGIALLALGLIGSAYSGSLVLALAAFAITGIGSGLVDVAPNYIVGALYAAGASAVLAALHTFYGLGASAGPMVVDWAVGRQDWHIAYVVAAGSCVAVGLLFLPRPAPVERRSPARSSSGAPVRARQGIHWLALAPLMLMIFLYNGAGSGMGDWLFTHMRLVGNADQETASRITSLYWLALTGGRILSIFLLSRLGNARVLGGALSLATVGAALLLLARPQIGLAALGVALVGLGFAPVFPVVIALGGQQQPEARGTVTGILSGAAAVGGMLIPVVQGWIGGGQSGGMIAVLAAAAIMLMALIWYTRMGRMLPVES